MQGELKWNFYVKLFFLKFTDKILTCVLQANFIKINMWFVRLFKKWHNDKLLCKLVEGFLLVYLRYVFLICV